MSTIWLSIIAFCSTCAGGIVALRQREQLQQVMAFAAGALVGLAAFQWLPRLFSVLALLPNERFAAFVALAGGFFAFHLLERLALHWQAEQCEVPAVAVGRPLLGIISVLLFSLHRLLEGATISLGFIVNPATGLLLAGAIILHNLVEGLNAVVLLLANRSSRRQAFAWLLFFACTPLLGALATIWISLPTALLPRYLGFFSGFLLYLGASHLLPASQRPNELWSLLWTLAGAGAALLMTVLLQPI
ncbi:MAG: ZIP family metal transporter [Thermogemmatispora sp.]|jgi:ZIP family zinc transporter|uniref:ZIP family metal transporter n=1 Tax=Thermogemmatispora sp. TaxID=1968838 RepID=UPI0019DCFF2E|nr:ZIP family metal transporter [Thermogemmatispora sp.]MBE3566952.1 ZIP family metal transporter [Thermogemmatispora sp.]